MMRCFVAPAFRPKGFLIVLFFGALATLTLFKISTYDTWFHLAVGREIVQQRSVPRTEIFTYPTEGSPRIYPSWLYGLWLYLLHLWGGERAIIIGRLLVVLTTFGVLLCHACRGGTPLVISVALLFVVALVARERFFDRPELLSYLFVACFLSVLNARPQGGKKPFIVLPLLQVLWANIHASAILGPFIIGTHWLLGGGQRFLQQKGWVQLEGTPDSRQWRRLGLLLLLVAAAGLLNPFTYQPLILPATLASGDIARDEIVELRVPTLDDLQGPYGLVLLLLALSFLLAWRKLHLTHLVLSGVFVYLSTGAVRFIPLMAIVAGPIMARNMGGFYARVVEVRLSRWRRSWAQTGRILVYGLVALACIAGTWWEIDQRSTYRFGLGVDRERVPVGALDYLDQNGIQGNVFNTLQFGGYIAWRGFPARKPFVDGRGGLPRDLLEKNLIAFANLHIWRELERTYGIDYAVLAYPAWERTSLDRAKAEEDWGLVDADWALVYWDSAALVYLKRVEKFHAIIERDEYHHVLPANDQSLLAAQLQDPTYASRVLAEVERALQEQPDNFRARAIQGMVFNQLGDYRKAIATYQHVLSHSTGERTVAYANLAFAYSRLGETERAIRFYHKVEKDFATNPEYFRVLAMLYDRKGELHTAVRYARKALKLRPHFLPALVQLREFYRKLGKMDLAAEADRGYAEAIRHNAGEQHFVEALGFYRQHKIPGAMEEYRKSIQVNPYNPAAHTNLGFLYYDSGVIEKALQGFLEALRIDPDWAEAHYGLALIYEGKGDLMQAEHHWQRYLEIKPQGYWSRRAKERLQQLQQR